MSQQSIRSKESATYLASETTFAQLPATMYRAFPIEGTVAIDMEVKQLDNLDARTNLYSYLAPVFGLKDGKIKLEFYAKCPTAQLLAGVAPVSHYMSEVFDAAWGYKFANSGSNRNLASSATVISVMPAEADNFELGSWIGVEVASVIEATKVIAIDLVGDTLTVFPALSGAPQSGARIINGYNFAPKQNHTGSLHLQHAICGDSNPTTQMVSSGSAINLTVSAKRNELAKFEVEGMIGSFLGPQALGFVTSSASDPFGSPTAVRDAIVYFQAAGSASPAVEYSLQEFTIKTMGGMSHIETLGGIEGKTSAFRRSARMFAQATLKFRYDNDVDAQTFANISLAQAAILIPKGSGITKRWVIVDMPNAYIFGKPQLSDENGLLYMTVTLHATGDTNIPFNALGPAVTELTNAPLRIALI
jgi:hypothetical protein